MGDAAKKTFAVVRQHQSEDPSKDLYEISDGTTRFTVPADVLARLQDAATPEDRFVSVEQQDAYPDPTAFRQGADGVIRDRTAAESKPVAIAPEPAEPPTTVYAENDPRSSLPPQAGGYPLPSFMERLLSGEGDSGPGDYADQPPPEVEDDPDRRTQWAALGRLGR